MENSRITIRSVNQMEHTETFTVESCDKQLTNRYGTLEDLKRFVETQGYKWCNKAQQPETQNSVHRNYTCSERSSSPQNERSNG